MKYHNENFVGIYDFRCKFHDGWSTETHLHEYTELLYCKDGMCEVTIDGVKIIIPKRHFIWLSPNSIHQYHPTQAKVICAVFSKDFIPIYFHTFADKRIIPTPIAANDLEKILDSLYLIDKNNHLLISGYLNLICAAVIENSTFEENKIADGVLYQKVINYLSTHFLEDVSLKSIAKHFGYNEKFFSHTIHSLTGISFRKLIHSYRVEYAKKLLDEKQLSISSIATKSGFSALNSFNRIFKEMTGITPSQYRKASQK